MSDTGQRPVLTKEGGLKHQSRKAAQAEGHSTHWGRKKTSLLQLAGTLFPGQLDGMRTLFLPGSLHTSSLLPNLKAEMREAHPECMGVARGFATAALQWPAERSAARAVAAEGCLLPVSATVIGIQAANSAWSRAWPWLPERTLLILELEGPARLTPRVPLSTSRQASRCRPGKQGLALGKSPLGQPVLGLGVCMAESR